ncbi:MAG: hypothetical protein ACKVQK_05620 [Burkholderiales bacterium]
MAKPNYDFAKRQRELSRAQKKEAKRLKKLGPTEEQAKDAGALPEAVPPTEEKPPVP